jgi:hypothetical protein
MGYLLNLGVCGEICPRLCRICDKDQVTEILFGDEDKPNARFVCLEDCKHIIELKAMDNWIKMTYEAGNSKEKRSIQLPKCPKCKTTIRNSIRYSNCIKRQLNLIEAIKSKQFGKRKENQSFESDILNQINLINQEEDVSLSQSFLKQMKKDIESFQMSHNELVGLKNNLSLYKNLIEINQEAEYLNFSQEKHIKFETKKIFSYIYNEQRKYIFLNEYQQRDEIFMEAERVEYLVKYYQLVNKAKEINSITDFGVKVEIGILLAKCEIYLINQIKQFNESNKKIIDDIFKSLMKLVKVELSSIEKKMIATAMGLQKGHWFKCPNGHVYCIGECARAVEESKCPDCKLSIGGTRYKLISDNTQARDFDEAL